MDTVLPLPPFIGILKGMESIYKRTEAEQAIARIARIEISREFICYRL